MKHTLAVLVLIVVSFQALAQSETYQTIHAKFKGGADVVSFGASGFLARTVLWIAGEHDFRDAIEEVRSFRFITIPMTAFAEQRVTVDGMHRLIINNYFSELARVSDHGDEVSVYLQTKKKKKDNRYLIVVEEDSDVVVLEILGNIDLDKLNSATQTAFNK